MRQDQERIRNLLIDTVTLLCKNSVQFQDELQVEGLLGVSVDKKDVFFIHISKEFSNSPANEPIVTQSVADSQEDAQAAEATSDAESAQGYTQHERQRSSPTKDTTDRAPQILNIKAEPVPPDEDECLIVEHPSVKLEGRASSAQVIAGQRRAVKRTSTADSQHYSSDSNISGGYGVGNSGDGDSFDNAHYGEPSSKRRTQEDGDADHDGYPLDGGNSAGTPWPSLAGSASFDPSHSFQQDSDNSPLDSSQPGCSTWPSARGVSDSVMLPWLTGQRMLAPPWQQPPTLQRKGERYHSCNICGKIFTTPSHLMIHQRVHTGERPFGCWVCGKNFNQKAALKRHEATHGPKDPSKPKRKKNCACPLCGKLFQSPYNLVVHQRIHTGEKPFSCSICGKCFTSKGTLKFHTENTVKKCQPPLQTSTVEENNGDPTVKTGTHEEHDITVAQIKAQELGGKGETEFNFGKVQIKTEELESTETEMNITEAQLKAVELAGTETEIDITEAQLKAVELHCESLD